jgi:hypothetical protein
MRITPVETQDLREVLKRDSRWTPGLRQSLTDCIRRFRLDQDVGDGRRTLRRTYTCPFYQPGPRGCSISRHHKPYGCLAFNPHAPGLTAGGACASDTALLTELETPAEQAENQRLRAVWGWTSDTLPVPMALLQTEEVSQYG